jgi:hypothetical protein
MGKEVLHGRFESINCGTLNSKCHSWVHASVNGLSQVVLLDSHVAYDGCEQNGDDDRFVFEKPHIYSYTKYK